MTAYQLRSLGPISQAPLRWVPIGFVAGLVIVLATACAAPISTQRSPHHLRVVEVRNDSDQYKTLIVEPTADQQLGASTTFTGLLHPGEVKVLYLYHGFEYHFAVFDEDSGELQAESRLGVHRNLGLVYGDGALTLDEGMVVEIGDPEVTFADSLQKDDPFGIRSGDAIVPDSTGVRRPADTGLGTRGRGRRP